MSSIQVLQDKQGLWADETFGYGRHPVPVLHHLEKEVKELIEEPFDLAEYADAVMLLLQAAQLAGFTTGDLIQASFDKLEVNRGRTWGEPDENGVIEHIRER